MLASGKFVPCAIQDCIHGPLYFFAQIYFLHREQGGTWWPLSDSLWSICARPLGASPATLFKVSDSKGRTQVTEFATYVPAASTCVEPLVEQRELGFGAQMLAHTFSSCVTLSCCLTPSSSQSL